MNNLDLETQATSKFLDQTLGEEIANSISHGIALALSITGLIFLIFKGIAKSDTTAIIAYVIYGISLILLFSSSTFSHALTHNKAKKLFQLMDYITIYILIAGSYTPVLLLGLNTFSAWVIFYINWAIVLFGIIFKLFYLGKKELVSNVLYLLMGWSGIFLFKDMSTLLPGPFIYFVIVAGVLYTLGLGFYLAVKLPYHHLIWHLFVLAGSISLFLGVLFFI